MKTPSLAAGAVLVALATGLAACGSGASQPGHVARQQGTAAAPVAPAAPDVPKGPDAALPNVAPAPAIATAQAAVARARVALDAAAANVFAHASDAALMPAMSAFSRDIAVVQKQSDIAFTSGQNGNCAASFAASGAANDALNPTKKDLAELGRVLHAIRGARAHYGTVRGEALAALQQLYNAIAGHPLATGPSSDVDAMRQAIAYDDHATADMVTQALSIINSAQATAASARQAVKQAALSPCIDVSA